MADAQRWYELKPSSPWSFGLSYQAVQVGGISKALVDILGKQLVFSCQKPTSKQCWENRSRISNADLGVSHCLSCQEKWPCQALGSHPNTGGVPNLVIDAAGYRYWWRYLFYGCYRSKYLFLLAAVAVGILISTCYDSDPKVFHKIQESLTAKNCHMFLLRNDWNEALARISFCRLRIWSFVVQYIWEMIPLNCPCEALTVEWTSESTSDSTITLGHEPISSID